MACAAARDEMDALGGGFGGGAEVKDFVLGVEG